MDKREEDRIEFELHKRAASNDPFAAAVRTTRMPMIVTDPSQHDNPIVFVNDAFLKLTGYRRDEILGRNCRFLQGAATNDEDITRVRNAIARREAIEIDLLNYRKDGSTFWNRLLISPVFDTEGNLTYFFASQFDVTPDRRRVSELQVSQAELELEIERRMLDLMSSENRLRFILKAAGMGVWTLDLDSQRLVASIHCKANFRREAEEPFSYEDLKASIHPDDRARWDAVVADAARKGSDFVIDYRIVTPRNELRWIEVRGQVSLNSEDQPVGMAGISLEITSRKEAEEHRKLLARELNHRVKNSLAIAQSIFTQSLNRSPTIEEARRAVLGRIQALSNAQDVLTLEGWSSASLRDVVDKALAPFANDNLRIAGPRVMLSAKAVSALSLALHELATNASKYGALATPEGSVTISWDVVSEPEPGLRFQWSEMNGPAVEPPTRKGFGSRVIEDNVSAELRGTAVLSFPPSGVRYDVMAPLQALSDD